MVSTAVLDSGIDLDARSSQTDSPDTKPRYAMGVKPFRRYFARIADIGLFSLLTVVVLLVAIFNIPAFAHAFAHAYETDSFLANALFTLTPLFVSAFVCAWMLSRWGTTPAKKAFGIEVRAKGEKLTFDQAISREFGVMVSGLCLGIPLLLIFTQLYSCFRLCKTGSTSWDEKGGIDVAHQRWSFFRASVAVFYSIAMLLLGAMFMVFLKHV